MSESVLRQADSAIQQLLNELEHQTDSAAATEFGSLEKLARQSAVILYLKRKLRKFLSLLEGSMSKDINRICRQ